MDGLAVRRSAHSQAPLVVRIDPAGLTPFDRKQSLRHPTQWALLDEVGYLLIHVGIAVHLFAE